MEMNKLTHFLGLSILFSFQVAAVAQPNQTSKQEVGIDEHLGDTLPQNLMFINEKNDTVSLRQIIDKPTVLTLVYFDCPGLCSPLLDGVSDVIEKCDMELGKDYQVLTISFNYKDTPEKAAQKKQTFLRRHSKSKSFAWIYMTGDSSNINKIADAVGFRFKKAGVDFIHPAAIMVLSPKGVITRYLYGISFLPFDFKMAIVEAGKGLPRPTISKVLEFCFAYDPQGKRYALEVTRVVGIIILFFSLILLISLILRPRKKS
jgi:protein SCO1